MRCAGTLLHISSLPNKYGIGSLGKEAYKFVDFLVRSNQKIWQILPIGPTSYGDSPYSALSSFAFNPYFIDLDLLVKEGLLKKDDLPEAKEFKDIDYNYLYTTRFEILHKAYLNKSLLQKEFDIFKEKEALWLNPYSEYMVLKKEHENKPWIEWYDDFKYRRQESMTWLRGQYKNQIDEIKFIQFLFVRQWMKLKKYANKKGIEIMGDMPIYCAYDSADVWANPSYYQLKEDLTPINVAGCPPDFFSEDGQLWGNPLYDYKKMEKDNYSWWVDRVKHSLEMFDILRIDHFRGFAGYYAIPYGDKNARGGHWEEGPGYKLFKQIEAKVPHANIVAENLGFLTKDVFKLLDKCGYKGMNIFQFELGDGKKKVPLKKGFKENNIFYTGTHDNQTIMSFYYELNKNNKKLIDEICGIDFYTKPNLKIIEYAMNTACDFVIIPLQDYLGITDEYGRMNTPSTALGNWKYLSKEMDYTKDLEEYIAKLVVKTNRI